MSNRYNEKSLTDSAFSKTLSLLALIIILISLGWRFIYRGNFVPGWDLLGQAQGLYLLETRGCWGLLKQAFTDSRHYQYWTPISSVIFTLIPGFFGKLIPWIHWAGVINFAIAVFSVVLILKISKLSEQEMPFILLAVAGSSSLLSFSLANYPNVTGALPHLLALAMILSPYFRDRPVLTFLSGLFISELCLHLYPIGQTFFILFILFSLLDRDSSWRLRFAWLGVAGTCLLFQYWAPVNMSGGIAFSLKNVLYLPVLLKAVFIERRFDNPLIFLVGLVSCFFVKRDRIPIILAYLGQWWLVLALIGFGGEGEVRSRRLLPIELYGLLLFALAIFDRRKDLWVKKRPTLVCQVILAALCCAVGWQLSSTANFTQIPIWQNTRPLPFVESPADYFNNPTITLAGKEIVRKVRNGDTILLSYDFSNYTENTTDPAGLLEYVYLSLGHHLFTERIIIFSPYKQRYSSIPMRERNKIADWLTEIKKNGQWRTLELWSYRSEINPIPQEDFKLLKEKIETVFKLNPIVKTLPEWNNFSFSPK